MELAQILDSSIYAGTVCIAEILDFHAEIMQKICRKFSEMQKIWPFLKNMQKSCRKFAENLQKLCRNYAETMQKFFRNAEIMQKSCRNHAEEAIDRGNF